MGFTTGLKLHSQAARLLGASDKRSTATPKSVPPLRTFHPLRAAAFQRTSGLDVPNLGRDDRLPNVTFLRTRWGRGFDAWLFPVRSPLLRESRLVTFPPLNDMLKFGGYSRPIPGRRLRSHICRLRDAVATDALPLRSPFIELSGLNAIGENGRLRRDGTDLDLGTRGLFASVVSAGSLTKAPSFAAPGERLNGVTV